MSARPSRACLMHADKDASTTLLLSDVDQLPEVVQAELAELWRGHASHALIATATKSPLTLAAERNFSHELALRPGHVRHRTAPAGPAARRRAAARPSATRRGQRHELEATRWFHQRSPRPAGRPSLAARNVDELADAVARGAPAGSGRRSHRPICGEHSSDGRCHGSGRRRGRRDRTRGVWPVSSTALIAHPLARREREIRAKPPNCWASLDLGSIAGWCSSVSSRLATADRSSRLSKLLGSPTMRLEIAGYLGNSPMREPALIVCERSGRWAARILGGVCRSRWRWQTLRKPGRMCSRTGSRAGEPVGLGALASERGRG